MLFVVRKYKITEQSFIAFLETVPCNNKTANNIYLQFFKDLGTMLHRCEKYEGMSMPKIAFASILLSNWPFFAISIIRLF
jgi:hypothetical protein